MPSTMRYWEALAWVNRSIDRKETFQNLRLKAYVLAKRSQFDEAVETANRALSEAESMDERPDGVDDLRSQIKSWTSGM